MISGTLTTPLTHEPTPVGQSAIIPARTFLNFLLNVGDEFVDIRAGQSISCQNRVKLGLIIVESFRNLYINTNMTLN